MRKVIYSWLFSVTILASAFGQNYDDRSGYYGDNFSLEGALDLFKQSYSLEDFERKINREDTWINNLDLDNNGRIDYIRVEHRRYDRNFHSIVLQTDLGRYDVQDVAVIEMEQVGNNKVDLQIVGDEDIFGNEVYVEPYRDSQKDVFRWPVVQSILDNQYQTYISPYRYQYYPSWWSPWNVVSYNVFRPRIVVYHTNYRICQPRLIHVHNYYKPYRSYCNTVVVHSNKVRVVHGKTPINRPAYTNNSRKNDGYYGSRRTDSTPSKNRSYNGSRSNGYDDNGSGSNSGTRTRENTRSDNGNQSPRDRGDVRDRGNINGSETQSSPVNKRRGYGSDTPATNSGTYNRNSERPAVQSDSNNKGRSYRTDGNSSKDKSYSQPNTPKSADREVNPSSKSNRAESSKQSSAAQRETGRKRN